MHDYMYIYVSCLLYEIIKYEYYNLKFFIIFVHFIVLYNAYLSNKYYLMQMP